MNRLRGCLAVLLLIAAATANAHDSWFAASAGGLELSTGNRFPLQEFNLAPGDIEAAQCTDGAVQRPLKSDRVLDRSLSFGAPTGALSCWAGVTARDIEIDPAKVKVYLAEIQAGESVRSTWTQWQSDGLPWRERYTKFARIELAAAAQATPQQRALARRPVNAPLEIVVLGVEPIATATPLEFQVLRDGQPLADFPVELVSERSRLGIWRRTDAQGRLRHTLPFGGRWLLRGTDLRASSEEAGRWRSRFVTLAIEAR